MPMRSFIALIVFIAVTASAHSQNLQIEKINLPASFITCLIPDGNGGTYIGTEDNGIFHYTQTGNIKQYTTKDKLGDNNAYALSIDNQGRLWAGHLNSGISIFNGSTWQNYGILEGPIGERIFDIQTCPTDDDVWIATSAGITRYKQDDDTWQHYTREDGLLEEQASALVFTASGTLIVGTQCHGLAIFERDNNDNYKHAKNITAPERFGVNNVSPVPLEPQGEGLPSNQINDICIAQDGTIWIATSTGLAKMNADMTNITYIRGKDYADKVRGLYGGAPASWKECSKEAMQKLLPEDYITCVTEDANGALWIGTRRCGFIVANPNTWEYTLYDNKTAGLPDNYVTSILLSQNAKPMIGMYGGGVVRLKDEIKVHVNTKRIPVKKERRVASRKVAFPSSVKPPTVEELQAMQTRLESLTEPLPKIFVAYYGDDWKTQGDWLGRITDEWAILCAMVSPLDNYFYHTRDYYDVNGFIGPNRGERDDLRRWVHWLKSEDRRVLYDPLGGFRRQSEWDDHGEAYPFTKDGPDLWYLLEIKHEGMFRLGMYFFNKDGHQSTNRFRDFMIEIYPANHSWQGYSDRPRLGAVAESQLTWHPPLAKSRVTNFWGGVHKQFVLKGPGKFYVKIDRNYSFNTIMSGIFVKQIFGEPTEDTRFGIPRLHHTRLNIYDLPKNYGDAEERKLALLWKILGEKIPFKQYEDYAGKYRKAILAYAANKSKQENASKEIKALTQAMRYLVNEWDDQMWSDWRYQMVVGREQFLRVNPQIIELLKNLENAEPPEFMKNHPK